MKKFKRRFYTVSKNHQQVLLRPDMLLEVKIHKDRTFDFNVINPKFTKKKLGKEISLSEVIKPSGIRFKYHHIMNFFNEVQNMAIELQKQKIKNDKNNL